MAALRNPSERTVRICRLLPLLPLLLCATLSVFAEIPRVGILATFSCDRSQRFYDAMRELGYVEGRNIVYDCVVVGDRISELPRLASEMAARKPTLIVTGSSPGIRAAQQATSNIPIVMSISADALREGFVQSLARPGGNTTGLTGMSMDLLVKRLELARELLPHARRLAVLTRRDPASTFMRAFTADMAMAAPRMGFEVKYYAVADAAEARALLPKIVSNGAELLYLTESPIFQGAHAKEIAQAVMENRLPSIAGGVSLAIAGAAIVSIGPNLSEVSSRSARYVDQIIKGAKPSDLPVEQLTRVEVVLNTKTARAVGVPIPASLLQRADKVID